MVTLHQNILHRIAAVWVCNAIAFLPAILEKPVAQQIPLPGSFSTIASYPQIDGLPPENIVLYRHVTPPCQTILGRRPCDHVDKKGRGTQKGSAP